MSDSDRPTWAEAARYGAMYEADFARATLEEVGIPVLIPDREDGIWGPGAMGPVSRGGIRVMVPSDRLDEARERLAPVEEDPEV